MVNTLKEEKKKTDNKMMYYVKTRFKTTVYYTAKIEQNVADVTDCDNRTEKKLFCGYLNLKEKSLCIYFLYIIL